MSSQTPTRRLTRRTDDRIIAGVASGLADYLGLDPVLVRVGFVVLTFLGGAGLVAYAGLWLLTPERSAGEPAATVAAVDRGAAFWVAIGLFVLAGLALADALFDRSIVWPLVLIGAGIALWRSDANRSAPAAPAATRPTGSATWPATPPPATSSSRPTETPQEHPMSTTAPTATTPGAQQDTAPAAGSDATAPQRPVPPSAPAWTPPPPPGGRPTDGGDDWQPPEQQRERSLLGRVTIAVLLIVIGVGALLDTADVIDVTAQTGFAVALIVLGGGLVVGAWVGRARWLALPAAIVVLPGLILTMAVDDLDLDIAAGIGQRTWTPDAVAEVQARYEHGIGEMVVDLSDVDFAGETVDTAVDLGIGQMTVLVPEDVDLAIDAELSAGDLDLVDVGDDGRRNGVNVDGTITDDGEPGAGELRLDLEATFGEIVVERR